MKAAGVVVSIGASMFALAGCPSDGDGNAPTLWLALDGRETEVKLIEKEPDPF